MKPFSIALSLELLAHKIIQLSAAAARLPQAPKGRQPKLYSKSEDEKIVVFIAKSKRFADTGGNVLLKIMEDKDVVPGR